MGERLLGNSVLKGLLGKQRGAQKLVFRIGQRKMRKRAGGKTKKKSIKLVIFDIPLLTAKNRERKAKIDFSTGSPPLLRRILHPPYTRPYT